MEWFSFVKNACSITLLSTIAIVGSLTVQAQDSIGETSSKQLVVYDSSYIESFNDPCCSREHPSVLPPSTPLPPGGKEFVFREAYLGMLVYPARRITYRLTINGRKVYLRIEKQCAKESLRNFDHTSLVSAEWLPGKRIELVGEASGSVPPFTIKVNPCGRKDSLDQLVLYCADGMIDVHPSSVAIVVGRKGEKDEIPPSSWVPPRTKKVHALLCSGPKLSNYEPPFSEGLAFVSHSDAAKKGEESIGVEWAFINNDCVVQRGGYRWIPKASMVDSK
jgi:hypothetical protein